MSKPEKINTRQDDLFRSRLSTQLNPKHPLFILTKVIDWEGLEAAFESLYQSELGHPPLPIRLMVGLMMLQHMEGLSDEQVVQKWVENPYYQYFCGYDHFQWKLPINPSSLTRWRKRIGPQGVEKILAATIQMGKDTGMISSKSCHKVIADTTVMEKAITFPTDSKLLNRAREKLTTLAKEEGIVLRQTYKRVGKMAYGQACRYGHAGQYKRMKKQVKKLKVYLGRVVRDIERKMTDQPKPALENLLTNAKRLIAQTKDTPKKLYALHAEEVECIAKGKAHKKYEFGCKVSLVLTHKEGFCLSAQALHGSPYDGHTLKEALTHAQTLSGEDIHEAFVDRGYRKHGVEDTKVFIARQKRVSRRIRRDLKRRNAVEPHIGHMKSEGKLGRNYLKGKMGDVLNALLVAVGHNLRLILNYLRDLLVFFWNWFKSLFSTNQVFFYSS